VAWLIKRYFEVAPQMAVAEFENAHEAFWMYMSEPQDVYLSTIYQQEQK